MKILVIVSIAVLVFAFAKFETTSTGVLHVSHSKGSTDPSCGATTAPCKDIHQAVFKCSKGCKIMMEGDHTLTSTIELTQDVAVIGVKGATISGSTKNQVAFQIMQPVQFELVNIHFFDIAMLTVYNKSDVRVINCSVRHLPTYMTREKAGKGNRKLRKTNRGYYVSNRSEIKRAVILLLSDENGSRIKVKNSSFTGWQEGFVLKMKEKSNVETSITFDGCTITDHLGLDFWLARVDLMLINSRFINTTCTAIFMAGIGNNSLLVNNSLFVRCKACSYLLRGGFHIGLKSGGAFSLEDISFVEVLNSKFVSCSTGLLPTETTAFGGEGGAIRMWSNRGNGIAIVRNCIFDKNIAHGSGGAIFLYDVTISLDNCTLSNNKAKTSSGGSISIDGLVPATFSNCIFINNTAKTTGGSLSIEEHISKGTSQVKQLFENNTFRGSSAEMEGGAVYLVSDGLLEIHSCEFRENSASHGGGLFLRNKNRLAKWFLGASYPAKIHNCAFKDNFAKSSGQSIHNAGLLSVKDTRVEALERYAGPHVISDDRKISFKNITVRLFRSSRYRLPSKSSGIVLKSEQISLSSGLNFSCPSNFILIMRNVSRTRATLRYSNGLETLYTFISIECVACPVGSYNLISGQLYLQELSSRFPPVNSITIKKEECLICPTGARCDGDITSVDNFWGYKTAYSTLKFDICPEGYCCGSETVPCTSYNTCAVGRKGTLCGTCSKGYKQNFIGNNCIPAGTPCNRMLFIIYFLMYTAGYTLVFSIVANLKHATTWIKTVLFNKGPVIDQENVENTDEKLPLAAIALMMVLFYQVAGLLHIRFQGGKQEEESNSSNKLVQRITEFFNFRFTVYQQLCPSDDLTLPQKEMILFGMKLVTFFYLFLLIIIDQIVRKVLLYWSSSNMSASSIPKDQNTEMMSTNSVECIETRKFQTNQSVSTTLSFSSKLKCTFIKLLKLYYTPITVASLKMLHCVNICNESRLYVYADHVCYSGWQIAIMVIILPCTVIFPVSFELAIRLIKGKRISSWQFVFACLFPYYGISMYIWKRLTSSTVIDATSVPLSGDEESFRYAILEAEESLFDEVADFSVSWQVVQFYRAFAITVFSTFLINSMYRQLAYIILLLIFVIHDNYRNPYKHDYLDMLQSLTSRCLVIVLTCNIIPAVSYLVNVRTVPFIYDVVKVLGVIELLVYVAVPLSLPVWKLKMYIENRRKKKT